MVTALILERPMCLDCIARKASISLNDVEAAFLHIARVVGLRRFTSERCRACGEYRTGVFAHQTTTSRRAPLNSPGSTDRIDNFARLTSGSFEGLRKSAGAPCSVIGKRSVGFGVLLIGPTNPEIRTPLTPLGP
jgi:hypothetical protein